MNDYEFGYDEGFIDGYKNNLVDISDKDFEYKLGYNEGFFDGVDEKRYDMKADQ